MLRHREPMIDTGPVVNLDGNGHCGDGSFQRRGITGTIRHGFERQSQITPEEAQRNGTRSRLHSSSISP
jgi:hypothetical protein